jgi:hypothetical protein
MTRFELLLSGAENNIPTSFAFYCSSAILAKYHLQGMDMKM